MQSLNARTAPTAVQGWAALMMLALIIGCTTWRLHAALGVERAAFFTLFGGVTVWRGAAILLARSCPEPTPITTGELPRYTVIAPLRGEALMIRSLVHALERLDYPRDRLQVILALEWDDPATLAAVRDAHPPPHFEIEIVPPGSPRTKPRACNAALERAMGEHVVVYDAEDRPDPGQLREAAARFLHAPPAMACLQAPLRIPLGGSFTMRQFALEYAALFELTLPALARLRAPFPLGGTSNHFRTSTLRELGGWDPWNVTEDADLGFRLAASGYRCEMLCRPTYEDPPRGLDEWLPQRSRWLKGYMQTWLVYMRRPGCGGLGWFLALQATIGASVLSSMVHAPTAVLMGLAVIASTAPHGGPIGAADLLLFCGGWGMAVLSMSSGAQRAGIKPRVLDALLAPLYWSLQSIAFWRAVVQLFTRPHHWDKTPHHPPDEIAEREGPRMSSKDAE